MASYWVAGGRTAGHMLHGGGSIRSAVRPQQVATALGAICRVKLSEPPNDTSGRSSPATRRLRTGGLRHRQRVYRAFGPEEISENAFGVKSVSDELPIDGLPSQHVTGKRARALLQRSTTRDAIEIGGSFLRTAQPRASHFTTRGLLNPRGNNCWTNDGDGDKRSTPAEQCRRGKATQWKVQAQASCRH